MTKEEIEALVKEAFLTGYEGGLNALEEAIKLLRNKTVERKAALAPKE